MCLSPKSDTKVISAPGAMGLQLRALFLLFLSILDHVGRKISQRDAIPVFAVLGGPQDATWLYPNMANDLALGIDDLVIFILAGTERVNGHVFALFSVG
jgi:hypothetical protein